MASDPVTSRYLDHLPAIFLQQPFMGRFLVAFERMLTGRFRLDGEPTGQPRGLEELLDQLPALFRPLSGSTQESSGDVLTRTPDAFLPWLADWVALSLRDDWTTDTQRAFIANAVALFRRRGTALGLKRFLELYPGVAAQVTEPTGLAGQPEGMQTPFFFQVQITVPTLDQMDAADRFARAVIDQEKPAHTYYGLEVICAEAQFRIINTPTEEKRGLLVGHTTLLGAIGDTADNSNPSSNTTTTTPNTFSNMWVWNKPDPEHPGLIIGDTTVLGGRAS